MISRIVSTMAILLVAAVVFAALDAWGETQAPRAREAVEAPLSEGELQAPRGADARDALPQHP